MIFISEKKTIKLPGETSFFVQFDYNEESVKCMKQCANSVYHKKEKVWEIPLTSLSQVLDSLARIDDIQLDILKDRTTKQTSIELPQFRTKPYQYQTDGIQYGLQHDDFLLLDVPGLGKSLQAIYIAQERKRLNGIEHCLIICGVNTLKTNWVKEIQTHSNLTCRILGQKINSKGNVVIGGVKDRISQLQEKIDEYFVITNIESLRDDDLLKALQTGANKFDMVVVDEIHACKSPTSQQGKNLLKLKAKYKIGMTGTLLLNDPLDCYVPLKWIGADRSTYTNFKYYYCNFGGPFGNIPMGYKNLDVLKDQLQDFSIRRTKDLLDLPDKTVINEFVDMSEEHKKFYNNIKNGIVQQVDKVHLSTANLLSLVSRLRQATVLPQILTTENIEPSKILRAVQLVDEIVQNGNKVVVFSTFKDSARYIFDLLKEYNPLLCTGDQKDTQIQEAINKFQTEDKNKVMVATWQKMGTGVTLTQASYAIFLDTPWTSGVYEQAQDRIHRIGSTSPVFIYNLICKGTVDERVVQIVDSKWALSNYVIDNDTSDEVINNLRQYIEELQ